MTGPIDIPGIVSDTEAGIFANHPPRPAFPLPVAPTSDEQPKAGNRVRQPLSPVACGNLPDRHFLFDSSAPVPEPGRPFELLRQAFRAFTAKLQEFPDSPMSIFGHADPVGKDLYNKFLSERRARAIFAIFVRREELWESLFSNRQGAAGDNWGLRTIQRMLDHLGFEPGNVDGKDDPLTKSSLEDVRLGLPAPADRQPVSKPVGKNDAPTRKILFKRYMETVCPNPPDEELYPLPAERFLGDPKSLRGAFQGCGSFNPQLILGKRETDELAKSGKLGDEVRNAAHEPDRRVIAYLFPAGTKIDSKRWPCPTAAESDEKVSGCRARFWSNGEKRKGTHFNDHRREFGKSVPATKQLLTPDDPELAQEMAREETTFACRFYHGIALHSPCERDLRLWIMRLLVDVPTIGVFKAPISGTQGEPRTVERNRQLPMGKVRFAATIGGIPGSPVVRGVTTPGGHLVLPFFEPEADVLLRVDAWGPRVGPDDPAIPPVEGTPAVDLTVPRKTPWPGEDVFHKLPFRGTLVHLKRGPAEDSDTPEPSEEEQTLGARQRLYDLGYGGGEPKDWSSGEQARAIRHFQRNHPPLQVTSELDDATIDALIAQTGEFARRQPASG